MTRCGSRETPHRWRKVHPIPSDRCKGCGIRYGALPPTEWHEAGCGR